MPSRINIIGQRYTRLFALWDAGWTHGKFPRRQTLCRCDCGNVLIVANGNLTFGHTTSCGCLRAEVSALRKLTHGKTYTRTYKIWQGMLKRCRHKRYKRYAGRGITVCERWLIFENFYADMGDCPPGLTIERIDRNGNYEPANCIWDTVKNQARNTSRNKSHSFGGKTGCLSFLCEEFNKNYDLVHERMRHGWNIERAFTEPVHWRRQKSHLFLAGLPG